MSTDLIHVRYQKGIHLPELDLWLDPHFAVPRGFVSHAHSDHVARHQVTLCSPLTGTLIRARYGSGVKRQRSYEEWPFGEPLRKDGWELTLLPSGHIPGAAMLHVRRLSDGATLLYTGDYKLSPNLSTEPCQLLQADVLIMETTFGLPQYRFPASAVTLERMLTFARETLAAGGIPVLMGYSLGKAQEILCALAALDAPIMLHPSVWEMTEVLASSISALPSYKPFDVATAAGHVLVFPPNQVRTGPLKDLPGVRTAMLTGWALNSSAKYRYPRRRGLAAE